MGISDYTYSLMCPNYLPTAMTEYIPSGYARDRELFDLFREWNKNRYGTEPSSQQAILCCDWARHILSNPPPKWIENGSNKINGETEE